MKNLFISAIYTSPPTTMGGNTKIMLEMIDALSSHVNITIFTTEPKTFKINLNSIKLVKIITISNKLKSFKFYNHLYEIVEVYKIMISYIETLSEKELSKSYIYSCSDFAPDVIPPFLIANKTKIRWIASLFLFIPNPIENLKNGYKFPFIKYIIYFFYQRSLFYLMKKSASIFLITNEEDLKMFPMKLRDHCFAVYGGVNIEEIPKIKEQSIAYDLINCGRVHPQKGVESLIRIWSLVVKELPNAKLCIIGNGEKNYVDRLLRIQKDLGLEKNIEWKGYVNGNEKYTLYSKSKIYAHPTVYDNNGMVAAEALCSGLPVIMFDLKNLKKIYVTSCLKIPCYNLELFAKEIIKLITNKNYYNQIKPKESDLYKFRDFWSWENRMKLLKDFFEREGIINHEK